MTSALPLTALLPVVALVCTVPAAQAQQGGPKERQMAAIGFIQKKQWAEAHKELDTAIRVFDKRAKNLGFGDSFGWFWFQRGMCEFNMGEYAKAIESFKQGIEKYPGKANSFANVSRIKMAEAYMKLGDYNQALPELVKYVDMRMKTPVSALDKVDKETNLGEVYAFTASCYFLASPSKFKEGIEALNKVAQNRYKGDGVSDMAIIQAFLAMTNMSIQNDQPEVILEFLKNSRSIVAVEAWRLPIFASQILGMAKGALDKSQQPNYAKAKEMTRVSQEMLALVPDLNDVDQSVADVISRLGIYPWVKDTTVFYSKEGSKKMAQNYKEAVEKAQQDPEAIALTFAAGQFAMSGAYRQAKAAFKTLKDDYLTLAPIMREGNHYNLISVTAPLGELDETQGYIKDFIAQYPSSERAKGLNNLALEGLYVDGRYEECVAQANQLLKTALLPPQKRVALFTRAASLFRLNKVQEAIPSLSLFLEEFPGDDKTPEAMYYLLTSYGRTKDFANAIKTADAFLKAYPNKGQTPFSEYVNYDRSLAFLNQDTDDGRAEAAVGLKKILKEYPESKLAPSIYVNLALIAEQQKDEAAQEKALKDALAAAQKFEDYAIQGEAIFKLVSLLGGPKKPRNDEAVGYYDTFYKDLAHKKEIFYRLQAGVAGLEAMKAAGKTQEGLDRLADLIVIVGKQNPENPLVEMAVNNYTKDYVANLKQGKADAALDLTAIRNHFFNFKGVAAEDLILTTILRMAVIGVYEDQLKKVDKNDTAKKAELEGQIKVFFEDLQKGFKIDQMTPFALVKIANYLGEKTERPDSAIPYYNEILRRQDPKFSNDATFGLARALGRSSNVADVDKAIEMMEKLIAQEKSKEKPDAKNVELASYNLARFYLNKKDYKKSADLAYEYLKDKNNKKYNIETSVLWAEANDKAGNVDNALTGYGRVNANFMGAIRHSAPSVKRLMELYYQRNNPKPDLDKPSDKLMAYNTGKNYIRLTQPLFEKMTVEERGLWRQVEELVSKYDADAEIQSEAKASADREKEKKANSGRK